VIGLVFDANRSFVWSPSAVLVPVGRSSGKEDFDARVSWSRGFTLPSWSRSRVKFDTHTSHGYRDDYTGTFVIARPLQSSCRGCE
jgi:hypothetical protein